MGVLDGLSAVWLRDHCRCAQCRDPRSGQRLFDVTDLPEDVRVAEVVASPASVTVTFAPDGHRSEYARTWLREHADGDGRTEDDKQLWSAGDLPTPLPRTAWSAYLADPVPALRQVLRLGFAVLTATPVREGAVLDVAATFGYVRETNYGRLFDVRVEPDPNNLAFTDRAIGPHTDNPYRDPAPTVQVLHCLRNDVEGGVSGLLDGFHAADVLRAEDRAAFDTLTGTPVTFAWSDATTALRADRPVIELDPLGRIRQVRVNNRCTTVPPAAAHDFYPAYRAWARIVARPGLPVRLRLDPGDCLILDNTRVLHSRSAFGGPGRRHLQGCYADLDALAGTVAVR